MINCEISDVAFCLIIDASSAVHRRLSMMNKIFATLDV